MELTCLYRLSLPLKSRDCRRVIILLLFLGGGTLSIAQDKNGLIDTVPKVHILQEIVVSASRVSEKQLIAPVSISKLTSTQIQQTASPSFFDAIGNMKGVQMIVPSFPLPGFRMKRRSWLPVKIKKQKVIPVQNLSIYLLIWLAPVSTSTFNISRWF